MLLCAKYVIPVTSDPIENGAVLVRDGRIADIGKAEILRLRYQDEELRDFGMAAITPGFIDLYACSEDAVLRGLVPDVPYAQWLKEIWGLRGKLAKSELYDSAYLGGLEALSSGITTMADITKTGACVRAAQDIGLRGVFYREVAAIERELVDYALKKGVRDLNKWKTLIDPDRICLGLAPSQVFRCHPAMYAAVTDYVNANGDIPIALRLAGSEEEYRFVKYGATFNSGESFDVEGFMEMPPWLPTAVTPVNYVLNWGGFRAKNTLAIHCVKVKDEDIRKLAEHDVAVAVCPTINAQLGMGAAPLMEFLRAGLRVGLSTNAPAALDSVDMFMEMRVAMQVQRSIRAGEFITAQTLLEMSTIRAAEALRMEDQVGSLEVGKRADIAAIDLSGSHQIPTNDPVSAVLSSSSGADVAMTMVDGNVLYDEGRWQVGGQVTQVISHVLEIRGRLRAESQGK